MADNTPHYLSYDVKRLNVGCGRNIQEGWINLDNSDLPGIDIKFDLEQCRTQRIPLPDNSVDEFLLSHVIEHIRDAMGVMEELYRIAKPGAVCRILVPYGSSDDAWEDPTHVRPYFLGSFAYFSQPTYWRADYGYRADWQTTTLALHLMQSRFAGIPQDQLLQLINQARNVVTEMAATMVAVKPARAPVRDLQAAANLELRLI